MVRKLFCIIIAGTIIAIAYPLMSEEQEMSCQGWVEFRSFEYNGEDSLAEPVRLKENEYRNPIMAGFYPDPSIVRVKEDYYLVNSTFAWYPGVPIFHSRDLVNWKQIGHVLDRPEQLPLDGAGVSRGIFAPSIRFHDDLYYMVTTNVDGTGNFYVTAENPAGPWSNPVLLPEISGIDPSFFFDDDGRAYIVHNGDPPDNRPLYQGHRALHLFPFDVKSGRVSGPGKIIVNGGTDIAKKPIWIEGPHIFKRNGFYYLIAAEGGTAEEHSEVVFRSRTIDGPYESYSGNPILTQRTLPSSRPEPITSTGHADFVETQNGEWWAVFLEKRDNNISEIASVGLTEKVNEIMFKVEGAGAQYRFFYRSGNEDWKQLGGVQDGTILSTKKAGGFVGTFVGMFARSLL